MAAKKQNPTAREQGFPEVYLGPAGNFKPGLDAAAKRDLIAAVLGLDSPNALHRFRRDKAERLLAARGWQHFVDRKAASLKRKGTKK